MSGRNLTQKRTTSTWVKATTPKQKANISLTPMLTTYTGGRWCSHFRTKTSNLFHALRRRTPFSATLRTNSESNPATLQTVWSETFLTTILQTPDDAETSYFAEVDLEFPPEIHEKFEKFPPCPETLKPDPAWFNYYQREFMEKHTRTQTPEN